MIPLLTEACSSLIIPLTVESGVVSLSVWRRDDARGMHNAVKSNPPSIRFHHPGAIIARDVLCARAFDAVTLVPQLFIFRTQVGKEVRPIG